MATFAGNLGNDAIEFYSLASTLLTAGSYRLVVSGVNSIDAASYSGNVAISAAAVPEPSGIALMLAGLGMGVLVIRRRQAR